MWLLRSREMMKNEMAATAGSLSYCVILPGSGLSQLSHIIIRYEKCVSQKRGLLSLLLDGAEAKSVIANHFCSWQLGLDSAAIETSSGKERTNNCMSGSSVSSGAAVNLTRKRHYTKSQLVMFAEALTVKVSVSLMPRCVATDSVRELNKCNVAFWEPTKGYQ